MDDAAEKTHQHGTQGEQPDREVRTRATWLATLVTLGGIALLGLGVAVTSGWLAVAGVALLLAGLLAAWRSGIMNDAHVSQTSSQELGQLAAGGTHQGLSPDQRMTSPQVRAEARESSRKAQRTAARSVVAGTPNLVPLGGIGLLLLGVWMSFSHMILAYPYSEAGQDSALRAAGFGIVLSLCGLTLLIRGGSLTATGAALVAGLLMILAGLLIQHDVARAAGNDVVSGVLALVFAGLTVGGGLRRLRR